MRVVRSFILKIKLYQFKPHTLNHSSSDDFSWEFDDLLLALINNDYGEKQDNKYQHEVSQLTHNIEAGKYCGLSVDSVIECSALAD
ncbi:hypothetical protein B1L02_10640 [Pseudoalteromonas piscicida]|uniref:Uncharacterized protein n=1 Tax=Pseudoalteromonas piscicida TaxID=43662 RepID=A0AAD0RFR5_PSEO7|nr:hypothetical protein B1L02_10640 [Pseudoalteromonas piscicida]AXR01877.1 hypothetical protein D0511_07120 [Pseudoalteromonas piscicida]